MTQRQALLTTYTSAAKYSCGSRGCAHSSRAEKVITKHNNWITASWEIRSVNVLFFKANCLLLLPWMGDVGYPFVCVCVCVCVCVARGLIARRWQGMIKRRQHNLISRGRTWGGQRWDLAPFPSSAGSEYRNVNGTTPTINCLSF